MDHIEFQEIGSELMEKDSFLDRKNMIVLLAISAESEGITGYQLQEKYKFSRGNLLRILDIMVKNEALTIKEAIVNGRAQKIYTLTEMGKEIMNHLIERWSERETMMEAAISTISLSQENDSQNKMLDRHNLNSHNNHQHKDYHESNHLMDTYSNKIGLFLNKHLMRQIDEASDKSQIIELLKKSEYMTEILLANFRTKIRSLQKAQDKINNLRQEVEINEKLSKYEIFLKLQESLDQMKKDFA